jgi:hypothetical protein
MATPRNTQAHQKRVQQIAAEAAEKIAADAPLEEEVIVVVEELPPGEAVRTQRGRSEETDPDATETVLGMVAQTQKLAADGIGRWINLVTTPFGTSDASIEPFGGLFDPRHLMQETFRLAEELLASQKQFALKVAEALTPARAA